MHKAKSTSHGYDHNTNTSTKSPSEVTRTKSHKKAPSDQGGWMQLKTGKSITSLGRQKSFSKSNDKSEGGSSSTEEHPRKLTVVVNEITNLHDIESDHYIEISLDCSDKIYSTKPLFGPVLKWNKKFNFHFILSEDVKVKFSLKTVAGEKASCELPFLGIFVGKNEKSKRQMLTSKGAGYCTLFYEISVDEESKEKSKEYKRLSQSRMTRTLDSLSRDSEDRSGTGSGNNSNNSGGNSNNNNKGSPIKKTSFRNSFGPNDSPQPSSNLNNGVNSGVNSGLNGSSRSAQETKSFEEPSQTFSTLPTHTVSETTEEYLFSEKNCVSNTSKDADYVYKVIIVGDSGVGKSCLLQRWVFMEFRNTTTTICVETQVKTYDVNGEIVSFQIWDTAGQEKFRSMTNSYYRGAHGVIIVYDITNYKSFDSITRWLQDVEFHSSDTPPKVLLIGNKSDSVASRTVSTQQGKALAQSQDLYFMETSALTGNQVQNAVQILLREIHKNKDAYSKVDLNGTSASTPESSNGVKIRRARDGNSDVTRPTESNSLTGDCC